MLASDYRVRSPHAGGQRGCRTAVLFWNRSRKAVRPYHGRADRSLRKIVFSAHTSTNLTFQPGVGIDVGAGSTAFRIQFDDRRVFFGTTDQTDPGASLVSKDGADYQDFTIAFGVVYRVGG